MKAVFVSSLCFAVLLSTGSWAVEERGSVTNLPLPRFVSMKTDEGNVRRGPSLTHRIDWVFHHEDMPLQIVAEFGHWRRVIDIEGQGGWMHYSLLSGARTALVQKDKIRVRSQPAEEAAAKAFAERGAIVRLGECSLDWCKVSSGRIKGWVRKTELWGVFATELRD
jgi:SH3-like domain-containing protein